MTNTDNAFSKAALLFSGTELLTGKINTYVPLFAAELDRLGFRAVYETTLPDNEDAITKAISMALDEAELVILVGGLGPTFDDVSREAAARATGTELVFKPEIVTYIKQRFIKFGRKMSPNNKRQAFILKGGVKLHNPNGTAPGQYLVFKKNGARKMIMLLPGPLREWQPLFQRTGTQAIKKTFPPKAHFASMELRAAGIPESHADAMLKPVMDEFPQAVFTILASPGSIRFIATIGAGTAAAAKRIAAKIEKRCREILGAGVYGGATDTLESVVGDLMKRNKLSLATAESCTGGQVSDRITSVAGSSEYFKGGIIAYSNELKMSVLGVRKETLKSHGAVSQECAIEMAEGAARATGADCAISITGIAGPGGGSAAKPVGLVYMAVAVRKKSTVCAKYNFVGDRDHIKANSATAALNLIRTTLQDKP